MARGVLSRLMTIGTPRAINGVSKIAESVGVRDRNDAEIQIGIGNSHRLANLIAIGQKLFAAKANDAAARRSFRGQFEKRWRPVPSGMP